MVEILSSFFYCMDHVEAASSGEHSQLRAMHFIDQERSGWARRRSGRQPQDSHPFHSTQSGRAAADLHQLEAPRRHLPCSRLGLQSLVCSCNSASSSIYDDCSRADKAGIVSAYLTATAFLASSSRLFTPPISACCIFPVPSSR